MNAPASPPVVGVDVGKVIMEAVFFGFEHGQCEAEWEPEWAKEIVDRCLRALSSPVGGDGSLQAEYRPSVPTEGHDTAVLDWKDAADGLCAEMLKQAPTQARRVADTLYETLLETVQDYLRDNVDYNLSADLSRARRKESEANTALQNVADALKVETRGFPNYPTLQMVEGLCLAAIEKLTPPASSRSPCMETLQASECTKTKHGEGA